MKLINSLLAVMLLVCADAYADRAEVDLSGSGWRLWQDKAAVWQNDELFLPPVDLVKLPVNPPTGGWEILNDTNGIPVSVPGTAEEYLSDGTGPGSVIWGVTWWWREMQIPDFKKSCRIVLHIGAARLRSEVYVNGRLVGYDIVANSPYDVDLTGHVEPGQKAKLAIRITNATGNFNWEDEPTHRWGKYSIPASHGFGGISDRVRLTVTDEVHIDDVYMQNQPDPRVVYAILTLKNWTGKAEEREVFLSVAKKEKPAKPVFTEKLSGLKLEPGLTEKTIEINMPDAELWDLDHPELYVCRVELKAGQKVSDSSGRTFGFRWFNADGQGTNALLRLNGKRVFLCSAISWGFWPFNGLYPTPEMAEKHIKAAQDLGMNMLNFHRAIGYPIVLDKADEMGLLYYAEPGGYVSGGMDPFARAINTEKLLRMVKRDRSHPSLVIYNMINEGVGHKKEEAYYPDIKAAHTLDPSRIITLASAWAMSFDRDELAKLHMRPFDDKTYLQGWWDNHRAPGPYVWHEGFYRNPKEHYGYIANEREVVFRGEEGAMSAAPRLGLIKEDLDKSERMGWDGAVYLDWYNALSDFMKRKGLMKYFGSVDNLCAEMGAVSIEHQGRKIEDHRICDVNDGYVINGWEAEIVDDHSGVVDCFRNPKGNPQLMAYYNQSLYVAVKTRNQVVNRGDNILVDFFAINEKDLRGAHTLRISAVDQSGVETFSKEVPVKLTGGDVFGELLAEAVSIRLDGSAGKYQINARLLDGVGKVKACGRDRVLAVDWKSSTFSGKGAVLESGDEVRRFLKEQKNVDVPVYDGTQGKLDWIVVAKSPKSEGAVIPAEVLRDATGEKQGLTATFFEGSNFEKKFSDRLDQKVDFNWSGKNPDAAVPQKDNYCVRWEGSLVPPADGEYQIGTVSDDGVRMWIDGKQLINCWQNGSDLRNEVKLNLKAGQAVKIRMEYFQGMGEAYISLRWLTPDGAGFKPESILERASRDGTTVLIIENAGSWGDLVKGNTEADYKGEFGIGWNWVGGQFFVREHPLFKDLPVNVGMNWPYQSVISGHRSGMRLEGEELVVGCYQTIPMTIGTTVGVIPCGKGRIVMSTLSIRPNLNRGDGPSQVARKLMCNYLEYGSEGKGE